MIPTAPLESRINVTPFLGVLLGLTALLMSVVPARTASMALDYPPGPGGVCCWEQISKNRQPFVSIALDGSLSVGNVAEGSRPSSQATLLADLASVSGDRRVAVRAEAETPYGRFAAIVRRLEAAGYAVSLVGEDLQ